ncbi:MAG: Fic family protein [Defluviitaleaceae bacterium]|nr:Fic family protein [Defluviitaleaceae bacterium]
MDLKNVDQLLQRLNDMRPLSQAELDYLQTKSRIEHVWSSTALEGNTINEEETAWIVLDGLTISGHPLREHFEIKATDLAFSQVMALVKENQPLTEAVMKEINKTVTTFTETDVNKWGQYRQVLVYPFGGDKETYSRWQDIPDQMFQLVRWIETDRRHPVLKAAKLHLDFVTIHPFVDGNGRTARLLMNFILVQNGYPVVNIQPDEASRMAYIQALKKAQLEQETAPFTTLIVNAVEKTLESRINWIKGMHGHHL